jgi:5S rRNA maturation endonuclease (ribonuclease M5)
MQQSEIIKQQGSITQLVEMLGYPITQKKIKSIYKEEKTASLTIYEATNSYYCFATGKGGDLFNFYADVKGLILDNEFNTIVREVGELLGIIDYNDEANKTTKSINIDVSLDKVSVKKEEPKVNPDLVQEISKAIFKDLKLSNVHFDYLTNERGLKPELTTKAGFKTLANLDVKKLIEDFDPLILEQMGILYQQKTLNSYLVDSLVIPFFDTNNELITLQFRIFNPSSKIKYKFYGATHTPEAYNIDQILKQIEKGTIKQGDNIFLTEGVIDTLTLLQEGQGAFAIMSASLSDKITDDKIKQLIKSKVNIIFAFDNDEAGQKLEEKIKARFEKLGAKKLSKVALPEKIKDINQYFVEKNNLSFEISRLEKVNNITGFSPYQITLDNLFKCTEELKSVQTSLTFDNKGKPKQLSLYSGTINAICARQGEGKTTLQANMAMEQIKKGKKVMFVTLEETERRLVIKLIAIMCHQLGLNLSSDVHFGNMAYHVRQQLIALKFGHIKSLESEMTEAIKLLKNNLTLVSLKNDITTFESVLNQLEASQESYDLIFIDYFQRIRGSKSLAGSWETAIEVADKLLDLAIKLDTVMIVGSQKNRAGREDADTASISGGDGLSNVCNVMLDIKRESGANKSRITIIKDRESQFVNRETKATIEINDNFITQNNSKNNSNLTTYEE